MKNDVIHSEQIFLVNSFLHQFNLDKTVEVQQFS